jgi:hypothetical protein
MLATKTSCQNDILKYAYFIIDAEGHFNFN